MKRHNKPLILAVDTSSPRLSLALWRGSELLGEKNLMANKGHAGEAHTFPFYFEKLLASQKIKSKELEVAAFGFGPGSYTGLRIGLAALKAMMCVLPTLKALRFSSLDLVAAGIKKPFIGVVIDARREKLYCNFYRREGSELKRLTDQPQLVALGEFERTLGRVTTKEKIWLAGDGLERYSAPLAKIKNCHFLSSDFWYPKASLAYGLIQQGTSQGVWLKLSSVRPNYLRPSEAEEKWGLCYDERDLK